MILFGLIVGKVKKKKKKKIKDAGSQVEKKVRHISWSIKRGVSREPDAGPASLCFSVSHGSCHSS